MRSDVVEQGSVRARRAAGLTGGRTLAAVLALLIAGLATPAAAGEGRPRAKRPRVAILDFPAAGNAWACSGWSNNERRMSAVIRDLLTTEISDRGDGALRLVERERLKDVRGELAFQQGGEVDPATAQKVGKLLGAQFVLTGKITRFACKKTDVASGWGIGKLVGKATGSDFAGDVAGSVKAKSASFTGRLDARLVEVRTGEIVGTFKDEHDTGNLGVKIAGGGNDVVYDDTLASKVFEPIAARIAENVVPKVERAARDAEEDEAEEAAQPARGGRGTDGGEDGGGRNGASDGEDDGGGGDRGARGGATGGGGGGGRGRGAEDGAPSAAAVAGGLQGEVYSPRFDFVPGEKPLFFDDFSDTEPGDFPSRWALGNLKGQLEVVDYQGKRWLKAIKPASGHGRNAGALLRVDLKKKLPVKYTLEFDVPSSGFFSVVFTHQYWFTGQDFVLFGPRSIQTRRMRDTALPAPSRPIRHVAIAVSGTAVKVYFDDERVLYDPEGIPSAAGDPRSAPATIGIGFSADGHGGTGSGPPRDDLMVTNVKVAEGGKDYAKDLAMSGRIVTHGITFDSGSDVIRPESGPTLRKILKLLQDDPALRFEIQGHTDDQGGDRVNGPLSERRARAVKGWLAGQGIEDARLTTKGLGASKPLQSNETAEGRAENRRVELVKVEA